MIRSKSTAAIGMSAQKFTRATPLAAPCSLVFGRVKTLSTQSKQPNSATYLESGSSTCNAILGATRSALCGALVTGLDFSRAALEFARRLADETALEANFVQGTVDEATHLTPGPFDLVFATWGTLCWLPDMRDWARVIATVLAPGGELYCADAHPGFVILEEHAGRLMPTFDFQTPRDRPLEFVEAATYTGDRTVMTHQSTRVWIHPMSAILGALIEAGLTITMFREHEVLPWRREAAQVTAQPGETVALSGDVQSMVPSSDRMWRLRVGHPRMPLSFSLRAKKGV